MAALKFPTPTHPRFLHRSTVPSPPKPPLSPRVSHPLTQFQKIGASVFFHEPYRQARGHGAPERYHTKLMAPGIDIVQGYQLALQNVEGGTTVAVGLSFATFIEPKPGNDFLVAKAGMRNEEELARALNEHNGAALHRRLSSGVR